MDSHETPIEELDSGNVLIKKNGIERGEALRTQVPLESHAQWLPSPDRPDPLSLAR